MAHYLVKANPQTERMEELQNRLKAGEFAHLKPFGEEVTYCLQHARRESDGRAVWEEEDYCVPPLDAERKAVLDQYFTEIGVKAVKEGEGWKKIKSLPPLFPALAVE